MKKILKPLFYFVIAWQFLGCQLQESRIDKKEVLGKIRQAANLASVEYVLTKVIISKKGSTLFGMQMGDDATFMAKTKATITAGINLSDLTNQDIEISDKTIHIEFPKVKMLNFSYPSEDFKTINEYTNKSFWNEIAINEKDDLFRQAEIDIKKSVEKLDIYRTGEANIRKLLTPILQSSGFETVIISFK